MSNLIHDPSIRKLGKRPAVFPKGLKSISSVVHSLPTPPPVVGYAHGIMSWNMDGNNSYGDCVFAAAAHGKQLWTTLTGRPVVPTTAETLAVYSALTGFNPNDPNTDNGAVPSEIWTDWKTKGIFGSKIENFVDVNPKDKTQVFDAIWFFGCAFVGMQLPISAQSQTIWDVPPGGPIGDGAPGSWGGHEVLATHADARYVEVITWGARQLMTWAFVFAYVDEISALLSDDWIGSNGKTPGGVPLASLRIDLPIVPTVK